MNRGEDWAGSPLAEPTAFHIGCTVAVAGDPAAARERLLRKVEAGAQFVLSAPVFDKKQLAALVRNLGPLPVPLLIGVLRWRAAATPSSCTMRCPAWCVPDAVRDRLRRAGTRGAVEGLRLAADLLAAARTRVAGAYLVPPNGRTEAILDLLQHVGTTPPRADAR